MSRLKYLLDQFATNSLTEAEFDELFGLIRQGENEEEIKSLLAADLDAQKSEGYDRLYWAKKFRSLTLNPSPSEWNFEKTPVPRIFPWWRVAVAASIILMLGISSYFFFKKSDNQTEIAKEHELPNDVAPGGNKAILILADGSQIILDSAANGSLAQQGNSKILKLDNGQLAYNSSGSPLEDGGTEVLYNTISTPRGGQYQLTLSDGSKVWLNAASSLRFPVSFVGKERKVELTGEGYFEVAKDASKPFKVKINTSLGDGGEVEVLGTNFNINSYTDEATINTTLLEGLVKVSMVNGQWSMIKPGEQAQVSSNIKVVKDVDLIKAIAWKNGLFDFDDDNITDIMRHLSRWYDVDINYSAPVTEQHYTGSIRREVNISQVLHMLELAGGVKFTIEGKKIVVKTK